MGPFFEQKIIKFCCSEPKKSLQNHPFLARFPKCPENENFSFSEHFRKTGQKWAFWGPSGRAKPWFLIKIVDFWPFFGVIRCSCWKSLKRSKIRKNRLFRGPEAKFHEILPPDLEKIDFSGFSSVWAIFSMNTLLPLQNGQKSMILIKNHGFAPLLVYR